MTAELKPEQRERLGRLAGAYLGPGADIDSAPTDR
jgi:hypothetical protein